MAGRFAAEQGGYLLPDFFGNYFFVDVPHLGLRQNLGLELSGLGGRDNVDAVIAVHIHEAQGAKAIEPNVGHPLDDLGLAVFFNGLFELLDGLGAFASGGAVFGQHQLEFGRHLFHEAAARGLGKLFELCGFHHICILFPLRISSSSALRMDST